MVEDKNQCKTEGRVIPLAQSRVSKSSIELRYGLTAGDGSHNDSFDPD